MSEERRNRSAGPPTMVMQAYESLSDARKRRMQRLGMALMGVGITPALLASVVLAVFSRPALPTPFWLFSGAVTLLGAALYWPPLGVWAANAIPAAISKMIPAKGLTDAIRPDRRASRDQEDEG